MKLLIELGSSLAEQLDAHLLRSGVGHEVFVRTAIRNQLASEKRADVEWEASSGAEEPSSPPPSRGSDDNADEVRGQPQVQDSLIRVPSPSLRRSRKELAFMPLSGEQPFSLDASAGVDWPWIQWNRYLPLKICARQILRFGATSGWPTYQRLVESLVHSAVGLRELLSKFDESARRGRNDRLATALPTEEATSVRRFVTQYVGSKSTEGVKPGAMLLYRLATCRDGRVGLTSRGIKFTQQWNPLLDGSGEPSEVLSEEEQAFLVEMIEREILFERAPFLTILRTTLDGGAQLADLTQAIEVHVPHSWSSTMRRNQTSAALSRMHDLGLLTKVRAGRSVMHAPSPAGVDLAGRFSNPL